MVLKNDYIDEIEWFNMIVDYCISLNRKWISYLIPNATQIKVYPLFVIASDDK